MPESTRQREAFDRYWALGAERSVETLHAVLRAEAGPAGKGPGLRTLYAWSSRYRWQDRVQELERTATAAADEARLAALREMYERQAREGLLLQQKGTEWLRDVPGAEATPDAGIRALVEGAKLERLARGEPSDRTQTKEQSDDDRDIFAGFSDEELRLLVDEAERLVARADPQTSA